MLLLKKKILQGKLPDLKKFDHVLVAELLEVLFAQLGAGEVAEHFLECVDVVAFDD